MEEMLLQYIWQHGLYKKQHLVTTKGLPIEIISHGMLNVNAGPDFVDARIRIGETLWVGCVEIHKKSSDWEVHRHNYDAAYNNVILHVVIKHDAEIQTASNIEIPTLEIQFNDQLTQNYRSLYESQLWIPCESKFKNIDSFRLNMWIETLSIERLERKSSSIISNIKALNTNYNEAFYRLLAANYGFKINAEPFERLARLTPLSVIHKIANNSIAVEAILFGQAGFLSDEMDDEYGKMLWQEYQILKHRFQLSGLEKSEWKFFRLRPSNFPTIRIAQFTALLSQSTDFIGLMLDCKKTDELRAHFQQPLNPYWETHSNFAKKSKQKFSSIGHTSIDNIMINTVTPFLFVYGQLHDNQTLTNKAFEWLEKIPKESNTIIIKWQQLGATIENARQSQGYLELKNMYCNQRRCLDCSLGCQIVAEV